MQTSRLLVVDNDAVIGRFVASVGAVCGYEVRSVFRADDFLHELDAWAPSHIALDLKVPDAERAALLRLLAERRCAARMVVISAAEDRIIESVRRLGIDSGLDIAAVLKRPLRAKILQSVLTDLKRDPGVIDESAIAAAIAGGELSLAFQPKVLLGETRSAEGGWRTAGFEALLRWHHPHRGMLTAGELLPLIKTPELMDEITDTVIDQSVAQLRHWSDRGLRTTLALNLSETCLRSNDLVDRLTCRCGEARILPEDLILELPERAAMVNPVEALDVLARLRLKGFHLSIDGFASSYASLAQLGRMPFSEIKINHALVADCAVSEQSRQILSRMVEMAHNLGLSVVAEGIETEASLDAVEKLGCDVAQGYQIAHPLDAAQAGTWLNQG